MRCKLRSDRRHGRVCTRLPHVRRPVPHDGLVGWPTKDPAGRRWHTRVALNGGNFVPCPATKFLAGPLAAGIVAEDHGGVTVTIRSLSNKRRRRARARLWRVVFVAVTMLLANTLAPWSMALASTPAAHATAHHCHDAASAKKPAQGSSCPCCDHGCQCLHTTAAPLPEFLVVPPLAPATAVANRDGAAAPTPPLAEQLRPPIA